MYLTSLSVFNVALSLFPTFKLFQYSEILVGT